MLNRDIYNKIKSIKGNEWTKQFAKDVYKNIADEDLKWIIENENIKVEV